MFYDIFYISMNHYIKRHISILSHIVLVFTIGFLIFHFLFFWVNAIIDSYFYWAIGQYFKTGIYPFIHPFIYARPPTVSPPAYGLFLNIIQLFPKPDIVLHAIQLVMLGGIGFFVYRTALLFISKSTSIIMACLTILIPGNMVYASLALTEIGAELFISIYVYLLALFYAKKKTSTLALACSLGFIVTTWKYAFIVFGFYAFVLFLLQKSKNISSYLIISIGIFIVLFWIYINHDITSVWGLSDNKAIIWNQIIMTGRTLPNENDPSMIKLRKYIPKETDLFQGYWGLQNYILPYHHNDWRVADRILTNVAYTTIKQHPLVYIKTAGYLFWQLHQSGLPYWTNMWIFGNPNPYIAKLFCEKLGNIQMCEPLIKLPNSFSIWNTFVRVSNTFYFTLFPFIASYVFLPSFIYLLFRGKKFERSLSMLYVLGTGPIAFFVHLDRRYIIPLYPIMILIIIFVLHKIFLRFDKFKQSFIF